MTTPDSPACKEKTERKRKVKTKHTGSIEAVRACEGETLLVVDDDKALRKMEAQMLRLLGYTVLEAEGPVQAMRLAAATPTIHLLLTDFGMPVANGLELTRQFRKVHPETPVLMISGSLEAIYGLAEYPDRFAVLPKPFTYEELVEQVCSLAERLNHPPRTRFTIVLPSRPSCPCVPARTRPDDKELPLGGTPPR